MTYLVYIVGLSSFDCGLPAALSSENNRLNDLYNIQPSVALAVDTRTLKQTGMSKTYKK